MILSPSPSTSRSEIPTEGPRLIASSFPSASLSPYALVLSVLQELYDSTGGPTWELPDISSGAWDFSSGQSYCAFHGVTCDVMEQITEIDLSQTNLRGTIPSEVGLLSSLTDLNLENNSITGTIPSEIGLLLSLRDIDLDNNSVTGSIPSEIGLLSLLILIIIQLQVQYHPSWGFCYR